MQPLLRPDEALFLDIDGTLVDFVMRPEDVRIPPSVSETIADLRERLDGAVAVVSGRSLADIDRLFAPLRLAAAGQHGAEARFSWDGASELLARAPAALDAILAAAEPFLAARPQLRVERKGLSAAVHYRGHEALGPELKAVLAAAHDPADKNLQLLDSHLCVELKPRSANKGAVVARFMATPPFEGRKPVFVGDDLTDEDGFREVLARGGRAIRVGLSGSSVAPERFADVPALRHWLHSSAAALMPREHSRG